MKKLNRMSTGLIASLILTNAITGASYAEDHNKYESKLNRQSKVIKHYKQVDKNYKELIKQKNKEIDSKIEKISKYNINISKLHKILNKVKRENAKLKRMAQRKEVNNETYFVVTAYTANQESTGKSFGDAAYGVTASGTNVQEGTTVACPPSLKFGTKIKIEDVGFRVCEDRGSTIQQNHLDLYVESLNEAIDFGRQTLKVKIID